eukprot:TRINITY_DN308_c0_g5_i1.p1 TRINITY_DN308_c0_g5~~TRINITY_DN308_c0_g5_i1.p1  ORF type:complete len:903 (-),score=210.59 TRINITY_DN308_c0_g5_i1:67-2775(-)
MESKQSEFTGEKVIQVLYHNQARKISVRKDTNLVQTLINVFALDETSKLVLFKSDISIDINFGTVEDKQIYNLQVTPLSITPAQVENTITVDFIENLFKNWKIKQEKYFFTNEFGRKYPLLDREMEKSAIKSLFKHHYTKLDSDRKVHPFMAFAGCPGSGKSRMMDEMADIISPTLKDLDSKATLLPIKVSYTNGTPFGKWDKYNPIAAFCWRILFAYYNPDISFSLFWNHLPKHWDTLELSTVLMFLCKPDVYVLFLLDEFQYLLSDGLIHPPDPSTIKEHGPSTMKLSDSDSILQRLIILLSEPLCSKPRQFFMAMSGIYVGPLNMVSTKSGYPITRIPLKPISFNTFHQIFPTNSPYILLRYHFGCLVGLPQLFISYEEYKMHMTEQEAYKKVIADFNSKIIDSKTNWVKPLFYAIAAYVAHTPVLISHCVGDTDFTYEDLQSNGFISVDGSGYLFIPYPLMMSLTAFVTDTLFVPMSNSLKYMKEEVDDRLSKEELWVLWERFGIGYKSLRTNALVLLNYTNTTFGKLHEGAIMTDVLAKTQIPLQNVEIKHSPVPFQSIDTILFTQSGQPINWKNGDCVVLNGPRGKAMDSFSYYPTTNLLDVEQRKQHEDCLIPSDIPKIVKPIRNLFGNDVFIGIFYNGPCSKKIKEDLDDNKVYVVAEDSLPIYYYAFKNHPVVSSEVYVNEPFTLQTSIASYIFPGSTRKRNIFAKKVVELRGKGYQFSSWNDLKTTICKQLNDRTYNNLKCTSHLKFNLFGIKKKGEQEETNEEEKYEEELKEEERETNEEEKYEEELKEEERETNEEEKYEEELKEKKKGEKYEKEPKKMKKGGKKKATKKKKEEKYKEEANEEEKSEEEMNKEEKFEKEHEEMKKVGGKKTHKRKMESENQQKRKKPKYL